MDNIESTETAITVDVESTTTVTSDIATPVATERATIMTTENPRTSSRNVLGKKYSTLVYNFITY